MGCWDGSGTRGAHWVGSRHRQQEHAYDEVGRPEQTNPSLYYQQHLLSAGAELEQSLGRQIRALVGFSYDVMLTPETGDKPSRDPMSAWSLGVGL